MYLTCCLLYRKAASYRGILASAPIQWIGLLTTAGTPQDVIERINAELNRALRDPDLIAKFAQQGLSPAVGTPADFQRTITSDLENWTETARAANITAD